MKTYKCLNCEWIGSEDDTASFYHWDSLYRVCPVAAPRVGAWIETRNLIMMNLYIYKMGKYQ